MTIRPVLLLIAMIAFIATPLLACCGADAAVAPVSSPAAHDCAHGAAADAASAEPHLACDGCDECDPSERAFVSSPKGDTATAGPLIAPSIGWSTGSVLAVRRFVHPPATAPPRPSPVRLHTKITV